MEPADLLPGLLKMLEERFGRVGYHLGNLALLAAVGSLVLMPTGIAAGGVFVLFPSILSETRSVADSALHSIVVYEIGFGIYLGSVTIMFKVVAVRARRAIERERAHNRLQYRAYMQLLNRIAVAWAQRGVNLETEWIEDLEEPNA